MRVLSPLLAVAVALATSGAGPAVLAASPDQDAAQVRQAVKVTVVIARYQGETRTSNLPYTLRMNINDKTNLRMSASVPVPTTTVVSRNGETPSAPVQQVTYQPIGTHIDCQVEALADGQYRAILTVNDSSVADSPDVAEAPFVSPPRILNFTSTNAVTLRDGESVEYLTAADKATGEIVKLSVSLEVVR